MRMRTTILTGILMAAWAAGSRGQELFTDENRFYLAPIVGASWATLVDEEYEPLVNGNLFTAGGAGGMAFARTNGQVRLEFEGRYRDQFSIGQQFATPLGPASADLEVTDNWSAMVNGWRDFSITDKLGIYGGGGIGAGGYGLNFNAGLTGQPPLLYARDRHTEFAWQVGAGVLYALHERITLDLGYRFYQVGLGRTTVTGPLAPFLAPDPVDTGLACNEMLLTLRIYDPFRRW